MSNLYRKFKSIFPDAPLLVGVVQAVAAGGCYVMMPDNSVVFARGTASIGNSVFVKGGAIEGLAPSLIAESIDI